MWTQANVKSSILVANLLEKVESEEGLVDDHCTTNAANAEQLQPPHLDGGVGEAKEEDISDVVGNVEVPLLQPVSPCAVAGDEEDLAFGLQASPASSGSLVEPLTVPSGLQQNESPARHLLQPNAETRDRGAAEEPLETQQGAPVRGFEHSLASCTQDFDECMSQTLQDAVANLDLPRHEGLADCFCPLESAQDQPIQSISISPFLNKHQLSARPSPWIHEPPAAARSLDLDAVIAAADTSFADCCADVEFLEMAIQEPATSPPPTAADLLITYPGEGQSRPRHIAAPEASPKCQPSGLLLSSPRSTVLPSVPNPALIGDNAADSGTHGDGHLEDNSCASPHCLSAPSVEAMAEVNHDNRDCAAPLTCTGDKAGSEANAPSVLEVNAQTIEQAEHPQSTQVPNGIQRRLDESRLTISSSSLQLQLTGVGRPLTHLPQNCSPAV